MSTRKPPRAEELTQVALMLGVGSVAACASWSHVVNLANRHGQPGWLAVADAAVLETLAVSMGLEVRRRRRSGESIAFAGCVLVTAVALQLAAQVAQAPRTFWGWTMAALPAVGFLVLAKTAIGRSAIAPDSTMAPEAAAPQSLPQEGDDLAPVAPALALTPEPSPVGAPPDQDELLNAARAVADDLERHSHALTRASLTAGLRSRGVKVGTSRAGIVLAALREEPRRRIDSGAPAARAVAS